MFCPVNFACGVRIRSIAVIAIIAAVEYPFIGRMIKMKASLRVHRKFIQKLQT